MRSSYLSWSRPTPQTRMLLIGWEWSKLQSSGSTRVNMRSWSTKSIPLPCKVTKRRTDWSYSFWTGWEMIEEKSATHFTVYRRLCSARLPRSFKDLSLNSCIKCVWSCLRISWVIWDALWADVCWEMLLIEVLSDYISWVAFYLRAITKHNKAPSRPRVQFGDCEA